MKKIFLSLLFGVSILSLTACGNAETENYNSQSENQEETVSEGSIDNESITSIDVIYNNVNYNLEDMSAVLFSDGWRIEAAYSQTYDLINDKYNYEIEIGFPEGSVEEAKDLETTTGSINSEVAISKLSNTKIDKFKIMKNDNNKVDDNFSVFGITLKTDASDIPALLPTITSTLDYNQANRFQRWNDYYSILIKCNSNVVNSIELKLFD